VERRMKKKLLLALTTVMVMASTITAYAKEVQIENDLGGNYSTINSTNAVSYEQLEGEFQNAATINAHGNTYVVYYNNEIIDSKGFKYKIHGITTTPNERIPDERIYPAEWGLYMKAEIIERPAERTSIGRVSMEASKNDITIDPSSWEADFLYYNAKGTLAAFLDYSDYTDNVGSVGFWQLCHTSNDYIESGNTIKIYIRSK